MFDHPVHYCQLEIAQFGQCLGTVYYSTALPYSREGTLVIELCIEQACNTALLAWVGLEKLTSMPGNCGLH